MAAGAVDGQAEKRLADDPEQVLHFVFASDGPLGGVGLGVARLIPRAADEQAGRDNRIAGDRVHDVAGHLLAHEPVVRLVLVETFNDVIAVVPCVVSQLVVFKPLTFRVAGGIKPVTAPALAIMRGGQQSVDQQTIRLG